MNAAEQIRAVLTERPEGATALEIAQICRLDSNMVRRVLRAATWAEIVSYAPTARQSAAVWAIKEQ